MTDTLKLRESIVIKRPVGEVFAAWTTADAMTEWFAPMAVKPAEVTINFEVQGRYGILMVMGEQEIRIEGEFREITVNEKIIFTWRCTAFPEPETMVTVSFKEIEEGTEVSVVHEKLLNEESRAGHSQGWVGCLGALRSYLEESDA